MNVDKYSNATAVLFRVFLELGIIYFIKKKGGIDLLKEKLKKKRKGQDEKDISLRQKMKISCEYMEKEKILTKSAL